MEKDLITLIKSFTGIEDLVDDRINFGRRPDDGYPYISLNLIYQDFPYEYSGNVNFYSTRVQVDFIGKTFGEVAAVEKLFSSQVNSLGLNQVVGDTTFMCIKFWSRFGNTEDLGVATETLEMVSREIIIYWKEA